MKPFKKFCLAYIVLTIASTTFGLTCHECGHMYDGATFMGIKDFDECQFFEHDIAENENKFLKECPDENEKCCFALREHMTIEFWGHVAAAEVFVHGCCSSLNKTDHHLTSSTPPPLVTSGMFRAEIMSQTIQNGYIKTRVSFCNTLGCNSQRVPWSEPIIMVQHDNQEPQDMVKRQSTPRNGRRNDEVEQTEVERPVVEESRRKFSNLERSKIEISTQDNFRLSEEDSLLALLEMRGRRRHPLESMRRNQGRNVDLTVLSEIIKSDKEQQLEQDEENQRRKENLLRELATQMGLSPPVVTSTTTTTTTTTTTASTSASTTESVHDLIIRGHNRTSFVAPKFGRQGAMICECQCSCPAVICPTFSLPALRSSAHRPDYSWHLLNLLHFTLLLQYFIEFFLLS